MAEPREEPSVIVARRYELQEHLGTGGAARVFAARDQVTGARVAVKLLAGGAVSTPARVRREVAAMRLLRLPGVVTLLDDGVHNDRPFLVMDLVEGEAFPGPTGADDWDGLQPITLSLLEILARVHAAGVVHRDLKPSNVFVGSDGRVTVLDFGLSGGPALGEAVTAVGTLVGTPEYLAPEQIGGKARDPRTDLYALGVMLYEALTGVLPHPQTDFGLLMDAKRTAVPLPVRRLVPDVPRAIADVVDQLLAIDPNDRPQSAGEVLRLLFGDERHFRTTDLPRLGGDDLVRRIADDAAAGGSTDVVGPSGIGKSRLLADVADLLTERGVRVHWLPPGNSPFASLVTLLDGFADLREASSAEAFEAITSRLRDELAAGTVVLVDDEHRIDRWSDEALARVRSNGAVVRAAGGKAKDGAVELRELSEEELRPLFKGPDRIFHLCEDGARELWVRTGGLPGRIVTEIAAWVRAGLARWEDGKLAVTREALERLGSGLPVGGELLLRPGSGGSRAAHLDDLLAWIALAWPHATLDLLAETSGHPRWSLEPELEALEEEGVIRRHDDGRIQPLVVPHALQAWPPEQRRAAHHELSAALPPGAPQRLRHLAAAGEPEEVIEESLLAARRLADNGHLGDALVVLEIGMNAARSARDSAGNSALLVQFVETCLGQGTPPAVERALYELDREPTDDSTVHQIRRLLLTTRDGGTDDAERMLTALDDVGRFDDESLELWRQLQRVRTTHALSIGRQETILREISGWATEHGSSIARATVASWEALHEYRQGRYREAAERHLAAANRAERPLQEAVSQLNAAFALLEAGELRRALGQAELARVHAASSRNSHHEAYAEWLTREVAYRLAEESAADDALVDAAAHIGDPTLEAIVCLTEAASAWRASDCAMARRLAARAARAAQSAGTRENYLVARALELVAGSAAAPHEIARLADEADERPEAEIAVQVLGLLARCEGAASARLRQRAQGHAARLQGLPADARVGVLSMTEAVGSPEAS